MPFHSALDSVEPAAGDVVVRGGIFVFFFSFSPGVDLHFDGDFPAARRTIHSISTRLSLSLSFRRLSTIFFFFRFSVSSEPD